jgi:hypothetical protein
MVPSESAPQELSNEWSCQYISTILKFLVNFYVPPLVTEVATSPSTEEVSGGLLFYQFNLNSF